MPARHTHKPTTLNISQGKDTGGQAIWTNAPSKRASNDLCYDEAEKATHYKAWWGNQRNENWTPDYQSKGRDLVFDEGGSCQRCPKMTAFGLICSTRMVESPRTRGFKLCLHLSYPLEERFTPNHSCTIHRGPQPRSAG